MEKFHTIGGGVKSGVFHTKKKKKKLPKWVSGHLESFKTHLFLGEKKYSVEKMYSVDSLTCAVGVVGSEVIL